MHAVEALLNNATIADEQQTKLHLDNNNRLTSSPIVKQKVFIANSDAIFSLRFVADGNSIWFSLCLLPVFLVHRQILLMASVNSVTQAVFCEINFLLCLGTNESSVSRHGL